jgi:ectoine hydroxylase-related dioxygenase (phytanoyl-CoA dioxygenase family)
MASERATDTQQRPDEALDAHARALRERGFTVVEHSHSAATVARFRAGIEALHRRCGAPVPYSAKGAQLGGDVQLAPTGFVVTRLLAQFPEFADELLCPDVIEIVRRVLGRDMHLELTGAVMCDATRPFFSWHNHIGGIDVEDYRARTTWPRFAESQRVIAVLYLDDIDVAGGELRAYPRAVSDPTDAPFDEMTPDWPGQAALHFPAGSTVIFEQCTWHAAMPKTSPGLRMFVGAYLTSSRAPRTEAVDDSLVGFSGGGTLLQSLLPGRP